METTNHSVLDFKNGGMAVMAFYFAMQKMCGSEADRAIIILDRHPDELYRILNYIDSDYYVWDPKNRWVVEGRYEF